MACLGFSHFFVLFFLVGLNEARNKPPLMVSDDSVKQRNKAAECTFGNQIRELGSQWIPDLGVPFGVLYCMKCECVQIQRKRRMVAKVQCRNIQKECPEPTCEEPVLLKGRCCKICPGDTRNPEIIQDVDIIPQNSLDDDERISKDYAALLTEKSSVVLKKDYLGLSPVERNPNKIIATGRFTLHKKNLHYSFIFSDRAPRPKSLQFIDSDGNILEEFMLTTEGVPLGFYQNATKKVCGTWRRVPRMYRRLLKQEKLFSVLVWGTKDNTEFTVSGLLTRYHVLAKEMFSSLMEPASNSDPLVMHGSGGTAVISVSTSLSPSIHISVIFNGLFEISEISDVPINITLHMEKKKVLEKQVLVRKPSNELNFVEISAVLENQDMRALARGRLSIAISSVSNPTRMKLNGHVVPKATCEIYQALLTSNNEQNSHGTTGLAWFYMTNDGSLKYNIHTDNLRGEIPAAITLIDLSTRRKTELEDLTPYFENGWANGTVDRISPKVLEPIFFGNLGVNIATQRSSSLIRGKLVSKLVADARDAPGPILLRRENYSLPSSAVGLAWLKIDNDCHIHYDISLTGLGFNDRKLELVLELLPMIAPGASVIKKHLDSFIGNQVENSPVESLSREELSKLDTGVGFIKIVENKATLLSAIISKLQIPTGCRSQENNNVPTFINGAENEEQPSGDCFHEGKFYQEEAQWTSSSNPCTMCFCQNGKKKCDTMMCPEPDCPSHLRVKMPGECCPFCASMLMDVQSKRNLPKKCIFSGKEYSKGSKFHPFLVPIGFDACTECVCDPDDVEIKCFRNSNAKSCCENCSKREFNQSDYPADEMPLKTPIFIQKNEKPTKSSDQILNEGGCRNLNNPLKPHENGSQYHPYIDSLGFYKCVTCNCNKGTQTCKRNHCDKAACEKMLKARRNKILNPAETCCSVKECRKFRHRKPHRNFSPVS